MKEILKHDKFNDIIVWVAVAIFLIIQPATGILMVSMGLYYETNKRKMKISKYLQYLPYLIFIMIFILVFCGVL